MSPFEFLSVAISFVTGLAVTVVLLGAVRAFRARDELTLDWIPFAWAASFLLIQFQIWFSMLTFRSVEEWPFHFFGLLILQSLTLFVASALILPADSTTYPTDLGRYFLRDGRWAVAAMAVQLVESVVINVAIGGFPLFQTFHLLHLALLAACLGVLVSRRRVVHVVATLAFLVVTTAAMVVTQVGQVYR